MNNSQFRRLVLDKPASTPQAPNGQSTPSRPHMTPMLGSRVRSSIPMTPRSVSGYNASNDFARQLAEHKREVTGEPPSKKFKSTAAPKGTKLAKGYQDRTSLRREEDDAETQDDKEKRVKALEEMVKLQQIDQGTFEKLRAEIGIGGDVGSTHLIKGLDWQLLERVRRGEDVTSSPTEMVEEPKPDVDEELDTMLEKEAEPVKKEERSKKGAMAPPSLKMQDDQKLSRNEILKRLKASRAAAAAEPPPPPEPSLGARFKKIGSGDLSEKKRFVETVNGRRREVLITTDKEGRAKRKVRWLDKEQPEQYPANTAPTSKPLGMEVPAEMLAKQKALLEQKSAEDEDDDIFQGVGAEYNPLADVEDDSSDGGSGSDIEENPPNMTASSAPTTTSTDPTQGPSSTTPQPRRNYFSTASTTAEPPTDATNPLTSSLDPAILAALKRAAALRQSQENANDGSAEEAANPSSPDSELDPEKLLRRKLFLENLKKREREDAQDMDLGFGESRFGDDDDEGEGEDGEMDVWEERGGDDGGAYTSRQKKKGGGGAAGGGARKRGPKKRKGDKDSMSDVMGVLEGRMRNKPGAGAGGGGVGR